MSKIVAPYIDNLKWNYSFGWDHYLKIDIKSSVLMEKLFDKLSFFENENTKEKDDWYYYFYYEADRGNVEDYANYEEELEEGNVKDYDEFLDDWKRNYPKEKYWYKFGFRKVKCDGKVFYLISIDNHIIVNVDPNNAKGWEEDISYIISPIIKIVDDVIKFIKKVDYKSYIYNNMPHEMRRGIISIKDFYKLYPDLKEKYYEKLNKYDINSFVSYIKKDNEKEKATRFMKMNSRLYFDLCAAGYRALGFDVDKKLTNKKLFLSKSDGRDHELSKLNEDSYEEFDKWYDKNEGFFDHTFEILPGRSFYRGDMRICKDDGGYYITLSGDNYFTSQNIIVFYMELRKKGVIPYLYNADLIVGRLEETVDIAVVSQIEDTYGYSIVFDNTYIDAITIPDHKQEEFINCVKWEDIELPKIAK